MTWWRRVFSRDRLESQLDAELRDHFDRLVADFIGAGHADARGTPAGAARIRRHRSGQGSLPRRARHAVGRRNAARTRATACAAFARTRDSRPSRSSRSRSASAPTSRSSTSSTRSCCGRCRCRTRTELITLTRWMDGNSSAHFSYPQVQRLADRTDLFTALCGIGSATLFMSVRPMRSSPSVRRGSAATISRPLALDAVHGSIVDCWPTINPAPRPSPCSRTITGRAASAVIASHRRPDAA